MVTTRQMPLKRHRKDWKRNAFGHIAIVGKRRFSAKGKGRTSGGGSSQQHKLLIPLRWEKIFTGKKELVVNMTTTSSPEKR